LENDFKGKNKKEGDVSNAFKKSLKDKQNEFRFCDSDDPADKHENGRWSSKM
jgi:hypothetical protein